ncbi:MAG: LamG-like jellyroll fold domain-containing protein [Lacipirellulaceae bacterium]
MKIFSLTRAFASLAIVALGVSTAVAQTPLAHWTFDEGIDDYSILSSTDTTGGAVSDATWQDAGGAGLTYGPGQIGGAAYLDGASEAGRSFLVTVDTALASATNFSISGWFLPATSQTGDNYKGLFMGRSVEDNSGMNQNWGLAYRDQNKIDGRASGGANTSADFTIVPDGGPNDGWYHAVLAWDGISSDHEIFINGVSQGTQSNDAFGILNGGMFDIGQDPTGGNNRYFRGALDDFAIYNVTLTSGQVTTIYNNGLGNGTTSTPANGSAVADFLPGDVDRNGTVDAGDYATIRDAMNSTVSGRDEGDLDANGVVNLDDFAEWRANAPAAVLASLGFVPEPSSLMLMGLAGLFGLGRSRRRS